jgi:transcriptional regulator with XRE-family HTH domain
LLITIGGPMKFLYERIKEERKRKNMTLKELSRLSEVSTGLISSMERGVVNPSIDVVIKICRSLNIDPANLMDTGIKGQLIISKRKDQYGIVDSKSNSFVVTPIGLQQSKIAILLTYINPKEEFGRKHISYDTDELILVLNGKVKFFYGEDEHILDVGDSVYFSADRIHYIKNLSAGKAILVWCVFNK